MRLVSEIVREQSKKSTPRRPKVIHLAATGVMAVKQGKIQRVDEFKSTNLPISQIVACDLVAVVWVDIFEIETSKVIQVQPSFHQRVGGSGAGGSRVGRSLERENPIDWSISLISEDWILVPQYLRRHFWERWSYFRCSVILRRTFASDYADLCFKIRARQCVNIISDISRFYED